MADLITLAELKTYVITGETNTTYDTPLAVIISAVSDRVRSAVGGCDILAGTYTAEEVTGRNNKYLDLKHWPILTVTTVTDQDGNAYTQGHDDDYTFDDFAVILNSGTWARKNKYFKVTYQAGYQKAGSITAIANYGGTVAGTVKATSASHGLSAGTSANVVITGTTNYNGTYTVTYIDANSFYFTATWGVTETGSWAWQGLPNDLKLLCYEMCAARFKAMKDKWQGESSRSFPDGSVTLITDVEFTRDQLAVIAKYRRPRM